MPLLLFLFPCLEGVDSTRTLVDSNWGIQSGKVTSYENSGGNRLLLSLSEFKDKITIRIINSINKNQKHISSSTHILSKSDLSAFLCSVSSFFISSKNPGKSNPSSSRPRNSSPSSRPETNWLDGNSS